MSPRVDVLMAAYNGAVFIAEQIESVLRQTSTDWRLVIRDDRSTDSTFEIAQAFAQRYPDRIVATQRATNTGSAKQNFLEMLVASRAPYVMFCDDDDVWLEDKIAVTLARMRELEDRRGTSTPLLVHSDLVVVDQALRVISPSRIAAQQLDGAETRLSRLTVQNMVTGCTVMVNRALADRVHAPFDHVIMHDWWLAMVASALGELSFIETPTMLYRQHAENAVGAQPTTTIGYNLVRLLDRTGTAKMLADSYAQAAFFLSRYEQELSAAQRALLQAYVAIPSHGKLGRLREIHRLGLWKNTAVRRLGQIVFV